MKKGEKFPLLRELVPDAAIETRAIVDAFTDLVRSEISWFRTLIKLAEGMKKALAANPSLMATEARAQPKPKLSPADVKNIVKKFDNWKDWYTENYDFIEALFGGDTPHFQKFLQTIAATSQRASVAGNVTLAIKAFKRMVYEGGTLPADFKDILISPVAKNVARAATGQPLTGPKIGAFAAALGGDKDAMALDRHVYEILFGIQSGTPARARVAKELISSVAKEMGLENRQVQAALWAANIARKGANPANYIDALIEQIDDLEAMLKELESLQAAA
jgi:hypothetical protein